MVTNLIVEETKTLLSTIEQLKTSSQAKLGSPLTDVGLNPTDAAKIESLAQSLEAKNPYRYPLLYKPGLLNGVWLLHYSTSREIRALTRLKFGFKVAKVYQVVDVASNSFLNQAFVEHQLGLVSGFVLVTAVFALAKNDSGLPDNQLNIQFLKRYLAITKLAGIATPQLTPFKEVNARNPQGRVPTFTITYLDEFLRIGRGGDGGLYILSKSELPQLQFVSKSQSR